MPTIPAGMPRDLERAVFLVFSDLTNRRATMGTFSGEGEPHQLVEHAGLAYLMQQLANGAPAAARYDGDIAAARALARPQPPFTVPAAGSRAALEVLVLVRHEIHSRMCCGQTGGPRVTTTPPTIQWKDATSGVILSTREGEPRLTEEFTVQRQADGTYQVSFGAGG